MSNSNSGAGAGGAASVAEEVAGLDRLLTRLALTEDAKLEKVLSKLLPLAISRLASPHEASRKKPPHPPLPPPPPHPPPPLPPLSPLPLPHPLPGIPSQRASPWYTQTWRFSAPHQQAAAVPVLLRGIASRAAAHQDMLLRCALHGLLRYGSPRGVGPGPEAQQLAATPGSSRRLLLTAGVGAAGAGTAAESSGVAVAGGAGAGSAAEAGEAAGGKAEAADAAGTGGGAAGKAAAAPSPDMRVWLEFCLQVMLLPASLSAAAAAAANAGAAQGQGGAAVGLAAGGRGAAVGAGGAGAELNVAGQQGGPTQTSTLLRTLTFTILLFPLSPSSSPNSHSPSRPLVCTADGGAELPGRHQGACPCVLPAPCAGRVGGVEGDGGDGGIGGDGVGAGMEGELRLLGAFVRSIAAANAFPGTLHVIFYARSLTAWDGGMAARQRRKRLTGIAG
ncbi:unnamed protein product [Closterium sp. NIES-54]